VRASRALGVLLAVLTAVAVYALWPRARHTPEDEVRLLVSRAIDAAQKRDVGAFSALIADDFRAAAVGSKQELKRMVAGYFFQNQHPLVVLNPALEVKVSAPTAATFTGTFVFGRGAGLEGGDGASRYEIEATLEQRGGAWLVTSASWHR
jgi:hypothetical protein